MGLQVVQFGIMFNRERQPTYFETTRNAATSKGKQRQIDEVARLAARMRTIARFGMQVELKGAGVGVGVIRSARGELVGVVVENVSKKAEQPAALAYTPGEWRAFMLGVKEGEFDMAEFPKTDQSMYSDNLSQVVGHEAPLALGAA